MKAVDPIAELERFCKRHRTHAAAAKALGISAPYLSDMLNGRRDFSDAMLARLGLRWAVVRA